MQADAKLWSFADPISMNVSRLAAKAQDCSAVGRMRPNTRCDKGLQAVG